MNPSTLKTTDARPRMLSTAVMMKLARTNHQNSALPARPTNWVYLWRTTTFHQLTSSMRPSGSVGRARVAVAPGSGSGRSRATP